MMWASHCRLVILMRNQSPPIRRVAPKGVCLLTLGCKLNQADSEAIARDLAAAGCRVVDRPAPADAYVINTCSVTHVAERKARHLARLARRLAPGAPVVVTGCYVERAGPGWAGSVGADLILRNDEKPSIAARLAGGGNGRPAVAAGNVGSCPRAAPALRTRAFLKVQEGCNDVCAFCVVPRTRGRERSVPIAEVVRAIRAREAEGVREVVLTGTQLGAYLPDLETGSRENTAGSGAAVLLQAILAATAVPRLRLSSLQPRDVTPELLALWENPRLCRHFHLALQSGSDAVLSRMRRRYTAGDFLRAVDLIRSRVPDAAITTDVIAGFPGETDGDFEETYAFCRRVAFAGLHVFPYSRRPGTAAAGMSEQVPEPVKRARVRRLLALALELRADFETRFQGRVMPVLWESARPAEGGLVWEGLTDNYVRVLASSSTDLRNRILPARLDGRREASGDLWAELVRV